jgi:hypothetical protein
MGHLIPGRKKANHRETEGKELKTKTKTPLPITPDARWTPSKRLMFSELV